MKFTHGHSPKKALAPLQFHLAALDRSEWFVGQGQFSSPKETQMVQIHICKDHQFYHYKVIKV